jgi:NADH dehydrogenase FAD-containing subunit
MKRASSGVSTDRDQRRELLTFVFSGGGFSGVEGAAAIQDLVHGAMRYFRAIKSASSSICSTWLRSRKASLMV